MKGYKIVTYAEVVKDTILHPRPRSEREEVLHRRFREDAQRQLEREAEDRAWGERNPPP